MKQVFEFDFPRRSPSGQCLCPAEQRRLRSRFRHDGSVDKRQRALFVDIMETLARKDAEKCARLMLELGEYDEEPDVHALEKEIDDFMGRHLFKSLKDIDLARLIQDLLDIDHEQ